MTSLAKEKFQRAFELLHWADAKMADEEKPQDQQAAADKAAQAIQPDVVRALLENWAATGLGHGVSSESKVASAIRNIIVRCKLTGKNARLSFYMPTETTPYVSKSGSKSPFYSVVGSLNFGSVRFSGYGSRLTQDLPTKRISGSTKSPVGAKAKRTIKKLALEGKVSKRALSAIQQGYVRKDGTRITQGLNIKEKDAVFATQGKLGTTVHMGSGIVVTPPKEFFKLTSRQHVFIGRRFAEEFAKHSAKGE